MRVTHEIPSDSVVYRHAETDDEIRYISRDEDSYHFRINGERSMELPTEDWPMYREFLEVDR